MPHATQLAVQQPHYVLFSTGGLPVQCSHNRCVIGFSANVVCVYYCMPCVSVWLAAVGCRHATQQMSSKVQMSMGCPGGESFACPGGNSFAGVSLLPEHLQEGTHASCRRSSISHISHSQTLIGGSYNNREVGGTCLLLHVSKPGTGTGRETFVS